MSRLYVFPEEGWCKNATKGFGEWLAERFNQDYTPLKNGGYAWNSGSYWAIQTESGKPEYDLEELRPFYKKEGKINDESTMFEKAKDFVKSYDDDRKRTVDVGKRALYLREHPLHPDECFKYGSDVDIELFRPSSLKRHTKRSKRDLKKSIKGMVSDFINPCTKVPWFEQNNSGGYSQGELAGAFSGTSSVFDISALKEQIRILKRQNYLLVRRSRK